METDQAADTNGKKILILCGFALVFIFGFATGYYYPDGGKGSEVLTVTDCNTDCAELFEAETSPSGDRPASASTGAVLGASVAAGVNPAQESAIGAFAGSKNSNLYHTKDCQYVNRIKAENIVRFSTQAEAQAAGRTAHSCVGG